MPRHLQSPADSLGKARLTSPQRTGQQINVSRLGLTSDNRTHLLRILGTKGLDANGAPHRLSEMVPAAAARRMFHSPSIDYPHFSRRTNQHLADDTCSSGQKRNYLTHQRWRRGK